MFATNRSARGILVGILSGAMAISVAPQFETGTSDVIVRGTDLAAVAAAVAEHGGDVELEIGLIDAVSADVPTGALDALRQDPRVVDVSDDASVALLAKTDLAGNHDGLTSEQAIVRSGGSLRWDGTGIDVAVVDSGIAATEALPESRIHRGVDLSFDPDGPADGYGHGTAMAGIIAGRTTKYAGSAPDARLVDVKVADSNGLADISQVLAGIDWVVSNRRTGGRNIRVMSLSFGTDGANPYDVSPLAYAVEAAWRHGIVVVVAAGNHGDDLGRLAMPAVDPYVIAVGAADLRKVASHGDLRDAKVPSWSASGDGVRNPDFVAAGASMLGARADGSKVAQEHPEAHEGSYLLGSGTSQAAAFTAGVVAAMLEARPSLTPDEVKAMLVASSLDLVDVPATRDGAGVLDLQALYPNGKLRSTPTGVAQDHGWSSGDGPLDGDRGSFVLEDADGNTLTGDNTVVGAFDREAWKTSTWSGSTWSGSTWSGSTWSGSTWSSSTWSASTWSGSTWSSEEWEDDESEDDGPGRSTWDDVKWGK